MVDLDSNPTKLIEIVEVGKQLLITRGALTTFSIANDVAKYFAILPAIFAFTYATTPGERGPLDALNVMNLGTPQSAIISAIIFNALDHPGARPARAARRQVPGDRRDRAAAPQPAHLRARRRDPAVRRDQADRPASSTTSSARRLACQCAAATGSCSGMAAGVGKTYRMLQEGRQAAAEGRDVVIGYLEPHDRPETAALAEGLEVVPRRRRRARRRSSSRRWTSTRSSAARPSSRSSTSSRTRTRRARGTRSATRTSTRCSTAGIDVISTVNVQHLESLNDAVFELTGVRVRETFPDRMLDEADEVVLVDLSPEALQQRLRAGKVYPRDRVERALAELLPRRQPRRAARARAARGRRGRRGAAAARPCSTRSASRRSASASSRSSSRSRVAAAPAPRVALGAAARRASWTRSGCAARARSRRPRRRRSSRRSGGSPSILGAHFLEEEGDDLVDDGAARGGRARLDVRLRRHARRAPAARDHCAARCVSRMVRELPGVDIRVVADRARAARSCDASEARGRPRRARTQRASRAQPRASSCRSPAQLDPVVLDAAIRIARAEEAMLVPAYLLVVPLELGPSAARPRRSQVAMPLLEAVEQAALRAGVPVDARIERGRTPTHALGACGRSSTSTGSSCPRPAAGPASPRRISPGSSSTRRARR